MNYLHYLKNYGEEQLIKYRIQYIIKSQDTRDILTPELHIFLNQGGPYLKRKKRLAIMESRWRKLSIFNKWQRSSTYP